MSRGFVASLILVLMASMIGFHQAIKKPADKQFVDSFQDMQKTATEWVGVYPPDFEIELLGGGTFRLSDVVGSKMVILNFFATWCGPCRSEIPELQRYADHHKEDVFMLGIDVKESVDDVHQFVLKRGMTYPVALDLNGLITALFEAGTMPTTIVIGLDGRVLLHEPGAISNAEIAFDSLLKRQKDLVDENGTISPDEFRAASAAAGHPSGRVPDDAIEVVLEGRALELAGRLRCPSCGGAIIDCDGGIAEKIRKRLAELDIENMSDAEVLEALYLLPEEEP